METDCIPKGINCALTLWFEKQSNVVIKKKIVTRAKRNFKQMKRKSVDTTG